MMTQSVGIWITAALVVACMMEQWAALLHGRFWHRSLWPLHASHHRKRRGHFEKNDILSALHAPIAIAFILYGCLGAPSILREVLFGVGIGMSIFGVAYLIFHDGFVHRRLPFSFLARVPLFARIRDAHRTHHATGREPYGFFLGPQELARARARRAAYATPPASRPSRLSQESECAVISAFDSRSRSHR